MPLPLPFLAGTLLLLSGGTLVYLPMPFPERLVVACLAIFLADALGGRWFGYAGLLILPAGLVSDPGGEWTAMLPIVVGSALAALVVRHAEPGWLGAPLAVAAFMLPVLGLLLVGRRLGPGIELPLGERYPLLHGLAAGFAVLASSLAAVPWGRAVGRREPG